MGKAPKNYSKRNIDKNKQGYNKYFCLFFWFTSKALCGDIDKLARRVGECPAGEIVQIFSKSFKFISRQNDSNPIDPPNLLNHREAVCLYKKQVPAERLNELSGDFNFQPQIAD